ncbi:hypothetical protein DENSPDRAFT_870733 [Dentipellis sp. KUC8613]|nr:hypothetical protein DENSPDRAFT_870733 [Dentipellis sp. KUC8613]
MESALVVGGSRPPAGKREPTQELEELNATRAAVSLPLEILVLIFSDLLLSSPPRKKEAGIELGWIRVTHVCRRWREVAVSAALLWTRITDLGPEWTRVSLERAGNAPLHLDQYEANSSTSPPVQDIARRLGQMRTLLIHDSCDILRPLLDRLHEPAPRLESLEVEISREGDGTQDCPVYELCGPLLNGGGGPLHHLRLENVFFQWNSFKFSSLVNLSISYTGNKKYENGEETRLPSLLSMLAIIREMTKLESLVLRYAIHASDSEEITQNLEPVSLLHLQHLILTHNKAINAAFLRNVIVKPQAMVGVYCPECIDLAWEADEDIHTLLNFMVGHIPAPEDIPFVSLCHQFDLTREGVFGMTLRFDNALSETFHVIFSLARPDNWLPCLKTAFSTVTQDRLATVEMRNEAGVSVDEWTEVFITTGLSLPELRELLVELDPSCSFLIALLNLPVEAIPSLELIVIDAEEGLELDMLDEVEECIVSARERGVPLERIGLRMSADSEGVEKWVDMLAAIVPKFGYSTEAETGQGLYDSPTFAKILFPEWDWEEDDDDDEENEDV